MVKDLDNKNLLKNLLKAVKKTYRSFKKNQSYKKFRKL